MISALLLTAAMTTGQLPLPENNVTRHVSFWRYDYMYTDTSTNEIVCMKVNSIDNRGFVSWSHDRYPANALRSGRIVVKDENGFVKCEQNIKLIITYPYGNMLEQVWTAIGVGGDIPYFHGNDPFRITVSSSAGTFYKGGRIASPVAPNANRYSGGPTSY